MNISLPTLPRMGRGRGLAVLLLAAFMALAPAACAGKQSIRDSQQAVKGAATYITHVEEILDRFQEEYADALEMFVNDPAKRAAIVAKVDPYLSKARAAIAAAKVLAETYANLPTPESWDEAGRRQFRRELVNSAAEIALAGIELTKLVKEFRE